MPWRSALFTAYGVVMKRIVTSVSALFLTVALAIAGCSMSKQDSNSEVNQLTTGTFYYTGSTPAIIEEETSLIINKDSKYAGYKVVPAGFPLVVEDDKGIGKAFTASFLYSDSTGCYITGQGHESDIKVAEALYMGKTTGKIPPTPNQLGMLLIAADKTRPLNMNGYMFTNAGFVSRLAQGQYIESAYSPMNIAELFDNYDTEIEGTLIVTPEGTKPNEYDILITKVAENAVETSDGNYDFRINLVDPDLLLMAGGLCRGMSGAFVAVIYNGEKYAIGSLGTVSINDPTMGFCYFFTKSIDEIENFEATETAKTK